MELAKDNLLEIKNPASCFCSMVGYMVKEPYLIIEIRVSESQKIYLNFRGVQYIDISDTWLGANLGLASHSDLNTLLDCLGLDNQEGLQLYGCLVEPEQNRWIKILAKEWSISTQAPYYWSVDGLRD